MPEITVELAVGDVVLIGNRTMMVVEIDETEVHFRVDEAPAQPDPEQIDPQDLYALAPADAEYRSKAK